MIIAIDGPAGSGKSSTAKEVARRLGILHLDTGAMYRAITLKCLRLGVRFDDDAGLARVVKETRLSFSGPPPNTRIFMDGEDVSEAVRSDDVTKNVSDYCKPAVVRAAMVKQQRAIGAGADAVCEGRDIGTVVFPDARLKFFMIASAEERARRRQKDFKKLGVAKSISELVREINERDRKDSTRELAPLAKAADAEELDTTDLDFERQVAHIINKARPLLKK